LINLFYWTLGEVSDSDSDNSSNNLSAPEEFDDGLDENLIRDDEDRHRLEQMTEKEREQELFNRIEKREVLRTRFVGLSRFNLYFIRFLQM